MTKPAPVCRPVHVCANMPEPTMVRAIAKLAAVVVMLMATTMTMAAVAVRQRVGEHVHESRWREDIRRQVTEGVGLCGRAETHAHTHAELRDGRAIVRAPCLCRST